MSTVHLVVVQTTRGSVQIHDVEQEMGHGVAVAQVPPRAGETIEARWERADQLARIIESGYQILTEERAL